MKCVASVSVIRIVSIITLERIVSLSNVAFRQIPPIGGRSGCIHTFALAFLLALKAEKKKNIIVTNIHGFSLVSSMSWSSWQQTRKEENNNNINNNVIIANDVIIYSIAMTTAISNAHRLATVVR